MCVLSYFFIEDKSANLQKYVLKWILHLLH